MGSYGNKYRRRYNDSLSISRWLVVSLAPRSPIVLSHTRHSEMPGAAYQILDIGWSDAENRFTATTSRQLRGSGAFLVRPEGVQLLEDTVVLHHSNSITVLWDFVNGKYASWAYDHPAPTLGVS